MASDEMNDRRRERRETENKRRIINYIVVALLAALIVTVLFLTFGRSDKDSNNAQVTPSTTTEKVDNSTNSNTVNRPPATVTRPATGNTVNRPSATGNTVNRPPATVTRPATGNTVNRPNSEPVTSGSSSKGEYTGRTDVPHTTKMDVLNGTYKDGDENKTNNNSSNSRTPSRGSRGGTRIR